ncbi:hypothetical protein NLJ89_g1377 [Agrocybe chaxingu]|uniref:NACHT domain-containing protein n=1 Tax=Agrocybe chaxingu TaxID=84603 RepID=A0A9W8N0A2_9AGAR|nr:hypothetical protein NLJ89_g1377 [Agrocybe chaxingu]
MFNLPQGHAFITGGTFNLQHTEGLRTPEDTRDVRKELRKCTAVGAIHDSIARVDPPRCHPGTRQDILEKLVDWAAEASISHLVMWLFGAAGAGKTAIAGTLAEILAQSDRLAATFFFLRDVETCSSEKHFVATIAYQLAFSIPVLRPHILKTIEDEPLVLVRSLETQFRRLIIEPMKAMAGPLSGSRRPQVIIIDGLDECKSRRAQRAILRIILEHLPTLCCHLKFLVLSRPEHHIQNMFEASPSTTLMSDLETDTTSHRSDIATFIIDKLKDIKESHPLKSTFRDEYWPSLSAIFELVDNSSGIFMYAHTVMKDIEITCDRPQDRLDTILGLSKRKGGPFKKLDELYRQILSTVRADRRSVLLIIGIALAGAMASGEVSGYFGTALVMAPPFIEKILCLPSGTVEATLIDLRSIININKPGIYPFPTLRFMHKSLVDFLLDPARSNELYIDLDISFGRIATGCLTVLKRSIYTAEWCKIGTIYPWDQEPEYLSILTWACNAASPNDRLLLAMLDFDSLPLLKKLYRSNPATSKYYQGAWDRISSFFRCLKSSKAFKDSPAYQHHSTIFGKMLLKRLHAYSKDAGGAALIGFTLLTCLPWPDGLQYEDFTDETLSVSGLRRSSGCESYSSRTIHLSKCIEIFFQDGCRVLELLINTGKATCNEVASHLFLRRLISFLPSTNAVANDYVIIELISDLLCDQQASHEFCVDNSKITNALCKCLSVLAAPRKSPYGMIDISEEEECYILGARVLLDRLCCYSEPHPRSSAPSDCFPSAKIRRRLTKLLNGMVLRPLKEINYDGEESLFKADYDVLVAATKSVTSTYLRAIRRSVFRWLIPGFRLQAEDSTPKPRNHYPVCAP